MFGAIEAGGTKFVCAIGDDKLQIIERVSFETKAPIETMKQVVDFFKQYKNDLQGIGVGSFGPIDLHHDSSTFGYIMDTPKTAWKNFDFYGYLKKHFALPISWTTDVNAACYGEFVQGHGKKLNSIVYYTIGTGIGGGAILNGQFVEGFSHPEMGHMLIKSHVNDDFVGTCPFHGNCLEGMAAGPAIEKRLGLKGQTLSDNNPFWKVEADYLAQCAYNTTLMFSPELIILGGGVMKQHKLIELVKEQFRDKMQEYVEFPNLDCYIVTPKLGDDAGITGCLALAKNENVMG